MSSSPPRLFVRREARADVADAFRWHEARGVGLRHEFLRALAVTLSSVLREPHRYPVTVDDIRKARVARFPYLVFYVVLPTRLSVIAVMYGRRHPYRWQSRR